MIPYKKFGVQSSSKTEVVSSTKGHGSEQVTAKGDKKSSRRRLSVAERLLQSQTSISPTKNEIQNGKIAQVKIKDKNSSF